MTHLLHLKGILKLTRYQEYWGTALATSLLGIIFSQNTLNLNMLPSIVIISIANILAVGFTFMINDIEDAEDDALNPQKKKRNPISAGLLSKHNANFYSLFVAIFSLLLFSLFTLPVFLSGLATIVIGYLYSWKKIRLKRLPVIDFISHSLMLAGFQYIAAFFALPNSPSLISLNFVLPFLLAVSVSCRGELFNEIRDLHYDKLSGLTHTAAIIGEKYTIQLMYAFLSIALGCIILAIAFKMIPLWFLILFSFLAVIFLLKPLLLAKKKKIVDISSILHDPIMNIVIISLCAWVVVKMFF